MTWTLRKVETSTPDPVRSVIRNTPVTDDYRERGGLARWGELVEWVRAHPEFVQKGEVVIAGGSPVMLYFRFGYGFVMRKHDGTLRMDSDPFEQPVKNGLKLFLALIEEDVKTPLYGTLEGS